MPDNDYTFPVGETQQPVVVNVTQSEPAAPQAPDIKAATRQQVLDFIHSGKSELTPAGTTHAPHSVGRQVLEGAAQGLAQDVLGPLSLLPDQLFPGVGNPFTREGTLGKWAYQDATQVQKLAQEAGSLAPLIFPLGDIAAAGPTLIGKAAGALSPAAVNRIASIFSQRFSPRVGQALTDYFGRASVRAPVTVTNAAGQTVSGGSPFHPRAIFNRPALARGAIAGGLVGASQEPEGDPSYTGRVAGTLAGAAAGAATGGLGAMVTRRMRGITPSNLPNLTAAQTANVNQWVAGLGSMIAGYGLGSAFGHPFAGIATALYLHSLRLPAAAIHHMTPNVLQAAMRYATHLQRGAPAVALEAARGANQTGP